MLHLLKAGELRALRGHLDCAAHEHGDHGALGSHVRVWRLSVVWVACRDIAYSGAHGVTSKHFDEEALHFGRDRVCAAQLR